MKRQYSHARYPLGGRIAINICYCERSHCSQPNIDNQQTGHFWIFIDNFHSNSNTKRWRRYRNVHITERKECKLSFCKNGFKNMFCLCELRSQSLQFLILLISVNNTQLNLNSAVLIKIVSYKTSSLTMARITTIKNVDNDSNSNKTGPSSANCASSTLNETHYYPICKCLHKIC